VYLKIAFAAPEQVGRFMFHCHILEHEDKGMMAGFEVVRP
jgi:suppressor of ftsI